MKVIVQQHWLQLGIVQAEFDTLGFLTLLNLTTLHLEQPCCPDPCPPQKRKSYSCQSVCVKKDRVSEEFSAAGKAL